MVVCCKCLLSYLVSADCRRVGQERTMSYLVLICFRVVYDVFLLGPMLISLTRFHVGRMDCDW